MRKGAVRLCATIGNMSAAPADVTVLRAILDAQRAAFRKKNPSYDDRIRALRALERAVIARKVEIAKVISDDFGGRAHEETLSLELFPLVNEIRHAARSLKRWMEPRFADTPWQFWPARSQVIYQPVGVVGILAAWNYPLFLSFGPLAGAIAAGDHAMLKPSELAPRAAELMAKIVAELYPPEYIAVVTGDGEKAAEFTHLPFDHILFTGSERVGKEVMKAASENLTPVTLELGGKSPALIHSSYSIKTAAARILAAKLYNAGQTCVAPDYVLLPRDRQTEFVDAAKEAVAGMYPRLAANPDYTHIVNARHYERLKNLVEDARRKGSGVVEMNPASEALDESARVFPPTLLLNCSDEMTAMNEEIFGPVLPVVVYSTLDEAVEYINARPHPLSMYYFDNNRKRVRDVLARTLAGGVTVNDCVLHVGQPNLPFGGIGPSGMGQYHGFDGFVTFSKKKGVFLQSRWSPVSFLRPPYGPLARRILKFLIGG